jgi:hypothetical protein
MYILGLIAAWLLGVWIGSRNKANITIGFGNTIEVNQVYDEVDSYEIDKGEFIECGTWIQDNFSQNAKQGDFKIMLPKGTMRMDFTDDHYSMKDIVDSYISRMK